MKPRFLQRSHCGSEQCSQETLFLFSHLFPLVFSLMITLNLTTHAHILSSVDCEFFFSKLQNQDDRRAKQKKIRFYFMFFFCFVVIVAFFSSLFFSMIFSFSFCAVTCIRQWNQGNTTTYVRKEANSLSWWQQSWTLLSLFLCKNRYLPPFFLLLFLFWRICTAWFVVEYFLFFPLVVSFLCQIFALSLTNENDLQSGFS